MCRWCTKSQLAVRFGVINASLRGELEIGNTPVLFRRPWELDDLIW